MRNWHHQRIKLSDALNMLTTNSNRVVIGVTEGLIEFESLSSPLHGLNYQAKNKGLFKVLSTNRQKSSVIEQASGLVTSNSNVNTSSSHATSVAGVILGNETDSLGNNLPVKGIIEDAELISMTNFFLNILFASIDDFRYYVNNGPIINTAFNSSILFSYDNISLYVPPNKEAVVINASIAPNIVNSLDIALYSVLFNTIKTYANNGRGALFVAAAGNKQSSNTIDVQHYGKHFTYPLIVSASTIDDEIVFDKVKEIRASYSSYGERVDLCAPSNSSKNGIYTTTTLRSGEIGVGDEVITKTITNQSQNSDLTLDNVHHIFPGSFVEIGQPDSINHEVLLIKEVDRVHNKIVFFSPRYYTAAPFTINPATVRIPVLRINATLIGTSRNTINLSETRGFGSIDQDICITNGTHYHYPKISKINSSVEYEFNPVLPASFNAGLPIIVTPGPITATPSSHSNVGDDLVLSFPSNYPNEILSSFVKEGMVSVIDRSATPKALLSMRHVKNINLVGAKKITLEKYNIQDPGLNIEITSGAVGSYTSSFGGTSAAAPVVSGVGGLVFRANPNLNVLEVKHILKSTADKINLKESSSPGKWKDANGNNVSGSYSSISESLTQATVLGSDEIFVTNVSNFHVNDNLEIDNDFRSLVKEVKPDRLVLELALTKVYSVGDNVQRGAYPVHSQFYGTGRVNAARAVRKALDWHSASPTQAVEKPILAIADRIEADGSILYSIPSSGDQTVNSPDIWIKEGTDTTTTVPTHAVPLNTFNTAVDQKIYVRVTNQGSLPSFKECDVRVFVAFTDEINPAFPFPTKWFDQTDVKLLGVQELPVIDFNTPNNQFVAVFDWKNIASFWNTHNQLPTTGGRRKRAYLLAHIAPFDGEFTMDGTTNLSLQNLRNNKQLTCKEIIATHNGVSDGTAFLPGNNFDITVGSEIIEKSFSLTMENVIATTLDTLKIKATKKNRLNDTEETILFSKTGGSWSIESGTPDWIEFTDPTESLAFEPNYKDAKFPYTLKVNAEGQEVKLEIVNA